MQTPGFSLGQGFFHDVFGKFKDFDIHLKRCDSVPGTRNFKIHVSGVIFSVDAYVANNTLLNTLFTLNPYYCFITLGRWTILAGNLQTDLLVSATVWTVAIIIVDRYSGYKRLANVYDGIILAFCWVHVRRDFLNAAKKHQGELEPWALSWVSDISELYKRYDARKEKLEACADQHPELCLEAKVEMVASEEQQALKEHVERMKARCKKELVELEAPIATESKGGAKAKRQRHRELAHREEKGKVLRSLSMHWCGLTLFIDYPEIPLDNNSAERALRGGAVARKNYYGSGAQWSIRLNECLFSLVATLEACKINVRTWMSHYLDHCASLGGKPPDKETIREWLPWNMTEAMRQKMSAPLALPPPPPKAESGADAISANTS